MAMRVDADGGGRRGGRRLGGLLAAAMLLLGLGGCATDPLARERVAAYVPQVSADERMPWKATPTTRPVGELTPPGTTEAAPLEPAANPTEAAATGTEAVASSNAALEATPAAPAGPVTPGRLLRRDDHVTISLRGIPQPEAVSAVVDTDGNVSLPLVGLIKLEGLSTAEAERMIEKAYISGGYYKHINVSIIAQEDAFYVRGEVKIPGKYPLVGDTTLMMAITAAGGYTDFAKQSKIKVTRGGEVINLNGARIETGQDKDFLIRPNDIIVVERSIIPGF